MAELFKLCCGLQRKQPSSYGKRQGRQQPADPHLISGERLSGGAPARRIHAAAAADAASDTPDEAVAASLDGSGGDSQRPADEPIDDKPVDENEKDDVPAGDGVLEEEILVPHIATTLAAAATAVNESPNVEPQEFHNADEQVARSQDNTFEVIEDEDASRDFERQSALSQYSPVDVDASDSVTTSGEVLNAITNEEASPGGVDVEMPVERVIISEMLAEPKSTGAAVPEGKSSCDPHEPRHQEVGGMSNGTATTDVVPHSVAETSPVELPDSLEPSLKQEARSNSDVVDAFSPSDQTAACSSDGAVAVASPSEAINEAVATLATDSQEQTSDDVHATSQQSSVLAADEALSNDGVVNVHVRELQEEAQSHEEVRHTFKVLFPQQQQLLQLTTLDRSAEEEDEHHQTRQWETAPLESSASDAVLADECHYKEDAEVLYNEWEESECEGYIAADGSIVYTKIVKKQVQEDIRVASSTRLQHPSSPSAVPPSETPEAAVSLQFGFDSAAALAVPTSLSSVPPSLSRGPGEIDYEEVRPDGSLVHRRVTVTVALGPDANVADVLEAGSQSSLEQAELQEQQPQAIVGRPNDNVLSRDVANSDASSLAAASKGSTHY